MSLINCPECNREVSDKANSCPTCGFPFANISWTGQDGSEAISSLNQNVVLDSKTNGIANFFSNRQPFEKLMLIAMILSLISYVVPWTRFTSVEYPEYMSFNSYIDKIDALLIILFYTYPAINIIRRTSFIKNYSILSSIGIIIYFLRLIINKISGIEELAHLGTFSASVGPWAVLIGAVVYGIGSFYIPVNASNKSTSGFIIGSIHNISFTIAGLALILWVISGNVFLIVFSITTILIVFSYPIFVKTCNGIFDKMYAILSSTVLNALLLILLVQSLENAYRVVCIIALLAASISYCIGSIKYREP